MPSLSVRFGTLQPSIKESTRSARAGTGNTEARGRNKVLDTLLNPATTRLYVRGAFSIDPHLQDLYSFPALPVGVGGEQQQRTQKHEQSTDGKSGGSECTSIPFVTNAVPLEPEGSSPLSSSAGVTWRRRRSTVGKLNCSQTCFRVTIVDRTRHQQEISEWQQQKTKKLRKKKQPTKRVSSIAKEAEESAVGKCCRLGIEVELVALLPTVPHPTVATANHKGSPSSEPNDKQPSTDNGSGSGSTADQNTSPSPSTESSPSKSQDVAELHEVVVAKGKQCVEVTVGESIIGLAFSPTTDENPRRRRSTESTDTNGGSDEADDSEGKKADSVKNTSKKGYPRGKSLKRNLEENFSFFEGNMTLHGCTLPSSCCGEELDGEALEMLSWELELGLVQAPLDYSMLSPRSASGIPQLEAIASEDFEALLQIAQEECSKTSRASDRFSFPNNELAPHAVVSDRAERQEEERRGCRSGLRVTPPPQPTHPPRRTIGPTTSAGEGDLEQPNSAIVMLPARDYKRIADATAALLSRLEPIALKIRGPVLFLNEWLDALEQASEKCVPFRGGSGSDTTPTTTDGVDTGKTQAEIWPIKKRWHALVQSCRALPLPLDVTVLLFAVVSLVLRVSVVFFLLPLSYAALRFCWPSGSVDASPSGNSVTAFVGDLNAKLRRKQHHRTESSDGRNSSTDGIRACESVLRLLERLGSMKNRIARHCFEPLPLLVRSVLFALWVALEAGGSFWSAVHVLLLLYSLFSVWNRVFRSDISTSGARETRKARFHLSIDLNYMTIEGFGCVLRFVLRRFLGLKLSGETAAVSPSGELPTHPPSTEGPSSDRFHEHRQITAEEVFDVLGSVRSMSCFEDEVPAQQEPATTGVSAGQAEEEGKGDGATTPEESGVIPPPLSAEHSEATLSLRPGSLPSSGRFGSAPRSEWFGAGDCEVVMVHLSGGFIAACGYGEYVLKLYLDGKLRRYSKPTAIRQMRSWEGLIFSFDECEEFASSSTSSTEGAVAASKEITTAKPSIGSGRSTPDPHQHATTTTTTTSSADAAPEEAPSSHYSLWSAARSISARVSHSVFGTSRATLSRESQLILGMTSSGRLSVEIYDLKCRSVVAQAPHVRMHDGRVDALLRSCREEYDTHIVGQLVLNVSTY